MSGRKSGEPYDPFDVLVDVFEARVQTLLSESYGGTDRKWLDACEKASALIEGPGAQHAKNATYQYFKENAFIEKRKELYQIAQDVMTYYGVTEGMRDLISGRYRFNFKVDRHTAYPYVCCAILRIAERAKLDGLHELQASADRGEHDDLQEDPLVYVVPNPRGKGGGGDHAAHRDGQAAVHELAGAAHPQGRPAGRRKRSRA